MGDAHEDAPDERDAATDGDADPTLPIGAG